MARIFLLYIIILSFAFPVQGARDKVCFKNSCFYVEVAATPYRRQAGLMGKRSFAQNEGMLFLFDREGNHSFWMKNTLIPLDIIWMDKNKKVVFIKNNAQPCRGSFCPSMYPGKDSIYVLEINAGLCEEIGIKIGDECKFFLEKQ